MPALSRVDLERLLGFVADAAATTSDQPFTPNFLEEMGTLVEADAIFYSELDRVRRRSLTYVERAPGEEEDADDDDDFFWEVFIEEHPLCLAQQLGDFSVRRLSDCLPRRELQSARFFKLGLEPLGVEYELDVAIPSPVWHTKTFMFNRGKGGTDFTERDRQVLELLQPHLGAMWEAAKTRRLLASALGELDEVDETAARGVVFLGPTGDVEFASPPAQRLLREFCGDSGSGLPAQVSAWLAAPSERLRIHRDDRELTVERSGKTLLLLERPVQPNLTRREREILAWVARGKTNPQIAELLWLAPSTVRKHLENAYPKLNVSSRTAAATRFLGLLDAEAS